MASTYELIVQATDKASGPLRKVDKSLGGIEKSAKIAAGALAAIGTGATLRSIVNTTARFEDLQDTLSTVTGSAEKGARAFEGIQKFATQTQFGVEELTNTYIKLAGAGIQPTTKLLTTFTDAAAITTDQLGTLEAITDLFSRTVSGGLGLEELNRLADRGIPVFRMLEEQLGITRLEVSEFGKTAEGARKITEALATAINNQYGGATQGKLDNLSTAMSNFGIAVTNSAARLGNQFRPQLTAAITEATNFITTNGELIDQLGTGLGAAIQGTAEALKFLAANFELLRNSFLAVAAVKFANGIANITAKLSSAANAGKTVETKLGGMATRMKSMISGAVRPLSSALSFLIPGGWLVKGIVGVVGTLTYFQDSMVKVGETSATLGEVFEALWTMAGDAASQAATFIQNQFDKAYNWLTNSNILFGNDFKNTLNKMGGFLREGLNFMMNLWVANVKFVKDLLWNIPAYFSGALGAAATLVTDFTNAVGAEFSKLGQAMSLALEGEFSAAWSKLGEDTGYSFTDSFQKATANMPDLIPEYQLDLSVDRVGQVGDAVSQLSLEIIGNIKEKAAPAFDLLVDKVENSVIANRAAHQEALRHSDAMRFLANEAAGATSQIVLQDDAVDNLGNSFQEAGEYINRFTAEEALMAQSLTATTGGLTTYEQALHRATMSAIEKTNQDSYATQIYSELVALQERGIISTEALADAERSLGLAKEKKNKETEKELSFLQQTVQARATELGNIKDVRKALFGQGDTVAKLAKEYKISESEVRGALMKRWMALEDVETKTMEVGEKSQTVAELMSGEFKKAGDSLSSDLATALRTGANLLDTFENAFNRMLDNILQAIIEKNITQPLIDQLMMGLGGVGGGLGGLFGGLFGGIGSLFGGGGPGTGLGVGGGNSAAGFVTGGWAYGGTPPVNKPALVGEKGPELFVPTSTGRVMTNDELSNMGGGGSTVVNFNINAVDTQTGVEFLLENKPTIVSMIQQASNSRGRRGILD